MVLTRSTSTGSPVVVKQMENTTIIKLTNVPVLLVLGYWSTKECALPSLPKLLYNFFKTPTASDIPGSQD